MTVIQDAIPHNHCYGCGPENPKGMQIKSEWDGETSVCRYTPRPEQSAGPAQYLYGGIIASLIDCHCVNTAIAHQYDREARPIGSEPYIWCVTGKLSVDYLAPTPIDRPVELRAEVVESSARKTVVRCRMMSGDTLTAKGEVVAVRVPDEWRASS